MSKAEPQIWTVTCAGNSNVQYDVVGELPPKHCPACGDKAHVQANETLRARPAKNGRHSWKRGHQYAVCVHCGCRYRLGFLQRGYEWPDGSRTSTAQVCGSRQVTDENKQN